MDVYLSGVLWVLCAAAAGAVIGYFVRRFGLDEGRPDNNEAAGQVFTIVGGLHAVLVAFVLISLFDAVDEADEGSYQEANSLVVASWAADSLPEPVGARVRDLSRSYADTVVNQEWPTMREGGEIPGEGWARLDELRAAVALAPTVDDWQAERKTEAANQLSEVYQARQERLTAAGADGIGAVVWFVLIVGSVITVMLANLFGGTKQKTHIVIVTTLCGVIAMLLFAIYQLQNPFGGGARVEPDAFQWAIARVS